MKKSTVVYKFNAPGTRLHGELVLHRPNSKGVNAVGTPHWKVASGLHYLYEKLDLYQETTHGQEDFEEGNQDRSNEAAYPLSRRRL